MKGIIASRYFICFIDDDNVELCETNGVFINSEGYPTVRNPLDRRKRPIALHRLVCGQPIRQEVDHIRNVKCDATLSALRVCSRSQNEKNKSFCTAAYIGFVTGYFLNQRYQLWLYEYDTDNSRVIADYDSMEDLVAYYEGLSLLRADWPISKLMSCPLANLDTLPKKEEAEKKPVPQPAEKSLKKQRKASSEPAHLPAAACQISDPQIHIDPAKLFDYPN